MWLLVDEVRRPYAAPFLAVSALCLAGGALLHMRVETDARRILSLLAGLASSWLLSTAGLAAYWNGPRVPGRARFRWIETAVSMCIGLVVVAVVMFAPLLLGLVRRAVRPRGVG
jgi:hypothetical protein